MVLTFLGTAASEGFPNAFCGCVSCAAARAEGGPSLRKRSAALLDDDLLIDLGPDLMAACLAHEVSLERIRYCIQTHDHEDHLEPHHFISRSAFCGVRAPRLEFFASGPSLARATAFLARYAPLGTLMDPEVEEKLNLRAVQVAAGQRFEVGPYRVLAIPAQHAPEALLYLIERGGRALLYATDTGPLPEEAWALLREHGGPIHLVAMDHTFGHQRRSTGHMNADQFVEQVERLRAEGLLAPDARVLAHHLAHHSHPAHARAAELAAERGYEIAYDGLRVTV